MGQTDAANVVMIADAIRINAKLVKPDARVKLGGIYKNMPLFAVR